MNKKFTGTADHPALWFLGLSAFSVIAGTLNGADIHSLSLMQFRIIEAPQNPVEITYYTDTLKHSSQNYFRDYTADEKKIILALNRISESRLKAGSVLVVPDTMLNDLIAYSPFPGLVDSCSMYPQLIVISQRIQAFAIYENGILVRWGPVSTGAEETPTPNGVFYTNWKSRLKTSTIDSGWIMPWYFNIDNRQGIALHEYVLPGYPASHGCIRLFEEDAVWIYNHAHPWKTDQKQGFIENGTPVIIFGNYDYNHKPPWSKLADNPDTTTLTTDELQVIYRQIAAIEPVVKLKR